MVHEHNASERGDGQSPINSSIISGVGGKVRSERTRRER